MMRRTQSGTSQSLSSTGRSLIDSHHSDESESDQSESEHDETLIQHNMADSRNNINKTHYHNQSSVPLHLHQIVVTDNHQGANMKNDYNFNQHQEKENYTQLRNHHHQRQNSFDSVNTGISDTNDGSTVSLKSWNSSLHGIFQSTPHYETNSQRNIQTNQNRNQTNPYHINDHNPISTDYRNNPVVQQLNQHRNTTSLSLNRQQPLPAQSSISNEKKPISLNPSSCTKADINIQCAIKPNHSTSIKNILAQVQQSGRLLHPFTPSPLQQYKHYTNNLPPQHQQQEKLQHEYTITAASFAKHAPKAGYLSKLGTSVSEYKRRFFVLKPTTCLYYFLSPNDDEPRGCIDLDGFNFKPKGKDDDSNSHLEENNGKLKIHEIGTLPDGRFRFYIELPSSHHDCNEFYNSTLNEDDNTNEMKSHLPNQTPPPNHKIYLEARNEDIGREWIQALTVERLSYSKDQVHQLSNTIQELKSKQMDLEAQMEEFRFMEKEKDDAMNDVISWKNRFYDLDMALNVLRRWLSRLPSSHEHSGNSNNKNNSNDDAGAILDKLESNKNESQPHHDLDSSFDSNRSTQNSFSFSDLQSFHDEDKLMKLLNLNGTNFASLSNACRGLQERFRLISDEANMTVDDLSAANAKLKASEERMVKAEKYICKLWEENCSLRDSMKHLKKEKKVLVKEVRSLREELLDARKQLDDAMKCNLDKNSVHDSDGRKEVKLNPRLETPEKKLLLELEESVSASLLHYQQLLGANDQDFTSEAPHSPLNQKIVSPIDDKTNNGVMKDNVILPHKFFEPREGAVTDYESANSSDDDDDESKQDLNRTFSPLRPKQLCLLDQATKVESEYELKEENDVYYEENHPIRKLEEEISLSGCSSSNRSLSPQPRKLRITETSKATTTIVCPLTDVTDTSDKSLYNHNTEKQTEGEIYHLTFYSEKIGLQFQKVPATTSSVGLLSDAMSATADSHISKEVNPTEANRTAAELRRIATISNYSVPPTTKERIGDICPVVIPKDIVLVCGFYGFDDSGNNNRRPSLGARLIAFDGISVETGPWTFDLIRKAIKARGRPLTLTFRNDFLTSKQRAILTKAAGDVNSSVPPPRRLVNLKDDAQLISTSEIQRGRNSFNEILLRELRLTENNSDTDTALSSNCSHSEIGRSFSDSGSFLSSTKIGPLVTGFVSSLANVKKKENEFTPEYFRRSSGTLESNPNHRDFTASLL